MAVRHNAAGYEAEWLSDYYTPEELPAMSDLFSRNYQKISIGSSVASTRKNYDTSELRQFNNFEMDALGVDNFSSPQTLQQPPPESQLLLVGADEWQEPPDELLFSFVDPAAPSLYRSAECKRGDAMALMLYSSHITVTALNSLGGDFDSGDAQDVITRCSTVVEGLKGRLRQRQSVGLRLVT